MDPKPLWHRLDMGSRISTRFFTRRLSLRVLGLLSICVVLYNVAYSTELRRRLEKVQALGGAGQPRYRTDTAEPKNGPSGSACYDTAFGRNGTEKATLVMLVRNSELYGALSSIRMVEDRFNRKFHYPWTFLNDKPFTDEFIKYTSGLASGPVEYAVVPEDDWSVPDHVNETTMRAEMLRMAKEEIIYGGSLSYRHMCRFNSGFFYNQEVMRKYDWYWRVEPGIELYCDINYDPFTFMRENKKIYGFVISMYEFKDTITTLWDRTRQFVAENSQFLHANNSLDFLVDGAQPSKPGDRHLGSGNYNLCHFWSNFEIASLEFYRGEAYSRYFEFLDSAGGFFYERWGDAPVHSIGVGLFAPKDSIHHFADFGYSHAPCSRCPQDDESHATGRCMCNRGQNFDTDGYSCLPRWWKVAGINKGTESI
ncbi:Glycosyltransferase Family 15 protein [Tuber magnatum]|uniref:Glycosyltransferase Family 15 protein n=1 Tax=Tuber magnatum TaxID=42249 RepID=A0A317T056_9PEZI|nr:Glycosyltransferase Family 15 protein [Tuber magnatum]